MSGERERFIRQLENAADHVRGLPAGDIAVLLRRAALRLRNFPMIEEPKNIHRQVEELTSEDASDATP
jgi:hypothetical protein